MAILSPPLGQAVPASAHGSGGLGAGGTGRHAAQLPAPGPPPRPLSQLCPAFLAVAGAHWLPRDGTRAIASQCARRFRPPGAGAPRT